MAFVGGAVAGKFCEMAIQMAVQQLVKETRLVVNFSEDFEWLNDQLTILRGFLTDAGEQSKQKEAVRKWLHKIQDSAMQAEDIVEECAVKSLYSNTISRVLSRNHVFFRHRMGREIKDVKDRMSSIIKEGELLRIGRDVLAPEQASSSTLQRAEWKKSGLLPIDSHPVGIESKVQYIISLLEKSALPVIAVVGMGGMGKTYLLQHVYNTTKERFDISIWLSISQSYSVSKLQHDLAFHLDLRKEIVEGKVTEQLAAQLINTKLEGKKCLIVFDDVWKPIMEDNLIDRLGLTIGSNCRLVITTRNKEVCRNMLAEIHEMEKLSEEDSWKLFCVYSFPNSVDNIPPHELEEVARNIVRECGNLPLAIKATAASVAGITPRREWELKLKQLREVSHLNNPMEILKLSYDCLPAHLKACFSYISFFPEDEKIGCEYLVSLWIGEGFILEEKDQWDIGWSYLYEMANLCLVEVWEEFESRKLKKYCRVHDLFHDLAIYISKGNKCVFDAEHAFTKGPSRKRSGGCYRILLPKKSMGNDVMAHSRLAGSPTLLRTLSLSNNELESIPAKIFVNMRGLRVLDLSGNRRLTKLPDCVGAMKLLKVLNLAGTGIEEVPRCVKRLKSLRFLDVSGCRNLRKLPVWIGEVKCLEHINVRSARKMPKGISKLSSLRILRFDIPLMLPVEHSEWLDLKDVGSMIELQEVGIIFIYESQWRSIEGGILGHLVNMRHFTMYNRFQRYDHMDLPLFPENLEGMADLERLRLERFAVRSSSLCSFANLRELYLYKCEWSDYPEFEKMGNLVSLNMPDNFQCRELPKAFGKASGFPKLRFLTIDGFSELEEFPELEEGAMPYLEVFELKYCRKLKNVPEGLELLKRLKQFSYWGTGTEEVRERLKKEGGQDWHKIKARNPHLIISGGD